MPGSAGRGGTPKGSKAGSATDLPKGGGGRPQEKGEEENQVRRREIQDSPLNEE